MNKELDSIIAGYDVLRTRGGGAVLATLVHVEGSSYRQAGARMLVSENGMMTGSISGGCLEGDALKKAMLALYQGQNRLVTYDSNDEEDAILGAQLGCNGVVQVLFEPLRYEQPDNPVELLRKVISKAQPAAIVTAFNLEKSKEQPGTVLCFDAEMNCAGSLDNPELLAAIQADAVGVLETGNSSFGEYRLSSETHHVFIQRYAPPPSLVLIGAGNDAQALAAMAELLGWKVTVADGRPGYASPQRFSESCSVLVTRPETLLNHIHLDHRTAVVLMTHNYLYDLAVLKLLLFHPEIPYIGILGPRKRFMRMLEEIQAAGTEVSAAQLSQIYAPMGLDLGGENATEIGLATLAEIQAVLNGAEGGHLRARNGPIHDRAKAGFKVWQVDGVWQT
jgi:xanthine dehydrogenase accessory factor